MISRPITLERHRGGNMGGAPLSGAVQDAYHDHNELDALTVTVPGLEVSGFEVVATSVQSDTLARCAAQDQIRTSS